MTPARGGGLETENALRRALGEGAYAAAVAKGARLELGEAIACALAIGA